MTTVATSTAVTATAYSNQRKLDRTQNGNLWACFWDGTATTSTSVDFYYSTDGGATWTAATGFGFAGTGTTYTPNMSLFIDLDDYAHVAYKDRSDGKIYYRRGTPNAGRTDWTWSSAELVFNGTSADFPDIIAHREGTGWTAHMALSRGGVSGQDRVYYVSIDVSSGGAFTLGALTIIGGVYNTSRDKLPSIDFNHTGDGKTVGGSTPHLYVAWSAGESGSGKGIRFKKATYAAGSWTWGTEREIDSGSYASAARISSVFDGTRVVIVYADSASSSTIKVRERDAGDTTTTTRTPTALSDGVVTGVSVTYDGDGDIHLWAVGTTSDDVKRLEYDRSAGTWDTWTTVATADAQADTLSLKRGYSDATVEAVFTDTTASPYNVVHQSLALNAAPTAATWDTANNQPADIAETLTLDWTFNDPDAGDTQSAYALSRQIGAGTVEYYNAGGPSWGASETKNTSGSTSVTLAASWGADADENHKYKVKTWDAADLEGVYGSELTVTPSAQDNPAITAPAAAGTVTASSVTMTWTASTQTQYKARLLSSTDVQIETTGWVVSADLTHTFAATLENSTTYKAEITTKNDEGLTSDVDTHTFSTSFTPPSTPTLTVSETPTGALTVAITNPAAGATEESNAVFVRVASGGQPVVDRTVADDGIRIGTGVAVDGSYVDYVVASGVTYQYLVRAFATNGASADSAWTS